MIEWSRYQKNPFNHILYQLRLINTQIKYFDHLGFRKGRFNIPIPDRIEGYQSKIAKLKDTRKGEVCTIICNGPSLQKINVDALKKYTTIGCNGVFKNFCNWGFETDYLFFEDTVQFEIRSKEIKKIKKSKCFAAIYNSYCLRNTKGWTFFNTPRCKNHYYYEHNEETYPQFSKDFASVVHLGSTVTYIMLQFAYHLGFSKIFIVGLDHNYGKLPQLFNPGKIDVTPENLELVQQCHFQKNYYKIGDRIGVPHVKNQEKSYQLAKNYFDEKGIDIINVGIDSKLEIFEKISIEKFNKL